MTASKDGDAGRAITLDLQDAEALFACCKVILRQIDEDDSDPDCDELRYALEALEAMDEAVS